VVRYITNFSFAIAGGGVRIREGDSREGKLGKVI